MVLIAIFVPLELAYSFIVSREVTFGNLINIAILVIIVDIFLTLLERKKR